MVNDSLFGRALKTIVLIFGIYIIIINICDLAIGGNSTDKLLETINVSSFQQFHASGRNRFKGFNWFFRELETFPGFTATAQFIGNLREFKNPLDGTEAFTGNVFDAVKYIATAITTPIWLIVITTCELIMNIIWFFGFIGSLFNPYVVDYHG